jgi:fructoselysine-6-P-deglycase FrlB-like protein
LVDASEYVHFTRTAPHSALVVLSRSGRSVEIVNLLGKAKNAGARVIGITNTPDSPLSEAADAVLMLNAPFDHLVSITMYSALALVGGLLAAAVLGVLNTSLKEELDASLSAATRALPDWSRAISSSDWFSPDQVTYFLARGGGVASSYEARLLWEEAAKAPASAVGTGAFRHGPQEALTQGLRFGMWIDAERMRLEDLALAKDIRKLGGRVLIIGQNLPDDAGDLVLQLPTITPGWQFLTDIMPAQIAAENLAKVRGVDCDSFRLCPYVVEFEGGLVTRNAIKNC